MNKQIQKVHRPILSSIVLWAVLSALLLNPSSELFAAETAQPLSDSERNMAAQINNVFRRAAAIVRPAVVSIRVLKPVPPSGFSPGGEQSGLGSGVIIDKRGYVITNHHVVANTSKIKVVLADGRHFEGVERLLDPDTDLALVRIEPKDQTLPTARFGDSEQAQVGDFVLAIGSPFGEGLAQTVTSGIISYKGRQTHILGKWGYEDFIQTDAAINLGNSGGPLVNLYGEVIGINSNIFSPSGYSTGYGFAVPSNIAKYVVQKLIEKKHVQRGWLGVYMAGLDTLRKIPKESWEPDLQKFIRENPDLLDELPKSLQGVLVTGVKPGDPAEQGGIKIKDVILQINDTKLTTARELQDIIARLDPGTVVKFIIRRNGSEITREVTLGDRDTARRRYVQGLTPKEKTARLGITIKPLNPELARFFGYNENLHGLIILSVQPDSVAEKSGLKIGDIVVSAGEVNIQGSPEGIERLKSIIKKADLKEKGMEMVVRNKSGQRTIIVKDTK
ncbi:MAG: trypsin-like peptidase domain-containing protein [Sedimentisphaerales bacterium]|nr:trypsin-like peptidase domain-containing protein [Sedimentisphaerales bacterium]